MSYLKLLRFHRLYGVDGPTYVYKLPCELPPVTFKPYKPGGEKLKTNKYGTPFVDVLEAVEKLRAGARMAVHAEDSSTGRYTEYWIYGGNTLYSWTEEDGSGPDVISVSGVYVTNRIYFEVPEIYTLPDVLDHLREGGWIRNIRTGERIKVEAGTFRREARHPVIRNVNTMECSFTVASLTKAEWLKE